MPHPGQPKAPAFAPTPALTLTAHLSPSLSPWSYPDPSPCHLWQPELEQLVPPHLAPFAASWQQHWTAKEMPKPEPEPAPEPAMLLPVPHPSPALGLIP